MARPVDENVVRDWMRIRQMGRDSDVAGLLGELDSPRQVSEGRVTFTIRERAIVELGKLRAAEAATPIINLLSDEQVSVRTEAAMALGRLGDQSAIAPLIDRLSDTDDSVRMWAAKSLGMLKAQSAVAGLIATLRDENPWVRLAAAKSLSRIGDQAARKPLKALVRREGFRHPVRSLRILRRGMILRVTAGRRRSGG